MTPVSLGLPIAPAGLAPGGSATQLTCKNSDFRLFGNSRVISGQDIVGLFVGNQSSPNHLVVKLTLVLCENQDRSTLVPLGAGKPWKRLGRYRQKRISRMKNVRRVGGIDHPRRRQILRVIASLAQ